VFQVGDRLSLLQIGLFSGVEETHVSLQTKPSLFESAASIILFTVGTELVFKGILPVNQNFLTD
jgi:hypothetical protein